MATQRAGIIALGTAVPERHMIQTAIGDAVLRAIPEATDAENRRIRQFVKRLYNCSGLEKRHTVLRTFPDSGIDGCFLPQTPGEFEGPSTEQRMSIYKREAAPLAETAAKRALASANDPQGRRVTHLITVSCTGFTAPGFEIDLIQRLKLNPSVSRVHIGFMGCYAALPALRVAEAFATADANACVLVVCLELCSLHYQHRFDPDFLTANSVFADGAAAAVVGSKLLATNQFFSFSGFNSSLIDDSHNDMGWIIGNNGFGMVLSQKVPQKVGAIIQSCFKATCQSASMSPDSIKHFAIHPGGKAILDKVVTGMPDYKPDLWASYQTLQSYGNMSSATLLFVIDRLMKQRISGPVFAAAFGPGLCAETAIVEAE